MRVAQQIIDYGINSLCHSVAGYAKSGKERLLDPTWPRVLNCSRRSLAPQLREASHRLFTSRSVSLFSTPFHQAKEGNLQWRRRVGQVCAIFATAIWIYSLFYIPPVIDYFVGSTNQQCVKDGLDEAFARAKRATDKGCDCTVTAKRTILGHYVVEADCPRYFGFDDFDGAWKYC